MERANGIGPLVQPEGVVDLVFELAVVCVRE